MPVSYLVLASKGHLITRKLATRSRISPPFKQLLLRFVNHRREGRGGRDSSSAHSVATKYSSWWCFFSFQLGNWKTTELLIGRSRYQESIEAISDLCTDVLLLDIQFGLVNGENGPIMKTQYVLMIRWSLCLKYEPSQAVIDRIRHLQLPFVYVSGEQVSKAACQLNWHFILSFCAIRSSWNIESTTSNGVIFWIQTRLWSIQIWWSLVIVFSALS